MNPLSRIPHARRLAPAAMLILLGSLAACKSDDPTPPSIPGPQATIGVDVTPDGCRFAWELTGPEGATYAGCGDTLLPGLVPGDWDMDWFDAAGHYPPFPTSETRSVAEDDTLVFEMTWIELRPDTLDILMIGNSYTGYNDLAGLVRDLAASLGQVANVEAYAPGGRRLDWHSTNQTTESYINDRDWDFVILQGTGVVVAYPQDSSFTLATMILRLNHKIVLNCNTTEVLFTLPWAYEDGMLWQAGGTDDYFAMQQKIYDNTLLLPAATGVGIVPIGWAWNTIMLEGPPEHYLFDEDFSHPSLRGSYLAACVIYSAIYRESAAGAPFISTLPADEAAHFQAVAGTIVLDDLELWELDD